MNPLLRRRFEIADELLEHQERRLDRRIGRGRRLALFRYAGIIIVGVPIAYCVDGFRWDATAAAGLAAGIALYGAVDVTRALMRAKGGSPP